MFLITRLKVTHSIPLFKSLEWVLTWFVISWQEMSNKEIDLTYKLKVLQQELEQEEASHKASRALLADKSKIKETIEGAKSESMKGKGHQRSVDYDCVCF